MKQGKKRSFECTNTRSKGKVVYDTTEKECLGGKVRRETGKRYCSSEGIKEGEIIKTIGVGFDGGVPVY